MSEFVVAVLAFLSMMGAALLGLFGKTTLRPEHLPDDTRNVVLLVANLFVVITALVLGLMLNSAKNTFETNNRDIRTLATEIILLDRTMRALGPVAEDARRQLLEYVRTSLKGANILEEDPQAEASLETVGIRLRAIRASDEQMVALWNDARQLYRQVVRQRWVVLDEYGGTIPRPLITIVILWLAVIFASFAYRAPRNAVVTVWLCLAALLISAAIYQILDMDRPSSSMTQTSNVPFQRALTQLQR
ncbi:MAG: hypothetical protein J2P54_26855 [Bradyrhizobiaceae bacterium]|nr:hypothetical protein [Bradyrhizobiaceae bacterium]